MIQDVRRDPRIRGCTGRPPRAGLLAAGAVIGTLALAVSGGAVSAQAPDRPRLGTNETYVILQSKGTVSSLRLHNEDGKQQVLKP